MKDVREGFVLVKDAGRLEAVLVLVRDVRQLVQVQEVRPHAVDVLFERDVVGQQLPRVLLHRDHGIMLLLVTDGRDMSHDKETLGQRGFKLDF